MKKIILSLLTTSLLIVACNGNKKTETTGNKDSMSSITESKAEKNKQTALASVMAINIHDADAVLKDAARDGMELGDGSMPPVKGIDSIKTGMKAFFAAFPDLKGDDFEAFSNADGSKVIVLGAWNGTFKNDFMGMKATGKSYSKIKDADVFTFDENGKVTSHSNIQSNMTYINAVGAMMTK